MDSPYILIVDDDPYAQDILATFVRQLGHRFKSANDGKEAMDLIYAESPALILLDIMMPVMDGFKVLAQLLAVPRLRHIPVIVVSALSAQESVVLERPNVVAMIEKARIDFDRLQALITKAVEGKNKKL